MGHRLTPIAVQHAMLVAYQHMSTTGKNDCDLRGDYEGWATRPLVAQHAHDVARKPIAA